MVSGLVKAAVFGLIIALMGCYHGYQSQRGAQGVAPAPRQGGLPQRGHGAHRAHSLPLRTHRRGAWAHSLV